MTTLPTRHHKHIEKIEKCIATAKTHDHFETCKKLIDDLYISEVGKSEHINPIKTHYYLAGIFDGKLNSKIMERSKIGVIVCDGDRRHYAYLKGKNPDDVVTIRTEDDLKGNRFREIMAVNNNEKVDGILELAKLHMDRFLDLKYHKENPSLFRSPQIPPNSKITVNNVIKWFHNIFRSN